MGKSSPKPPPAPDPSTVAAAQTNSNDNTALFQSTLNNTNQVTPYGDVNYNLGPGGQWTETTTLSPAEQGIFNGETAAAAGALDTANQQIPRVQNALAQGLAAPTLQTSAPIDNLAMGYSSGGPIQYGFNPGGPVTTGFSAGGPITTGFSAGGPIQSQVAPTYSPFSSLQAGAAGGAGSGGLGALASNPVLGTQLATYAQARQLLDPQWSQNAEQQQAQLTAQGLNPNDAAYQNAMRSFGTQENQAYGQALYDAINAGDAEQNTLFGQNLSAGQFANAAQQQGYNQNQGQAEFANAAQQQGYEQNLGQAQFANQAQAQQYGENQGEAQFYNSAQNQANAQNQAAAAFYNAALGQNFQENYQNAQLANQAAQQGFQDQAYAQELPINELNSLMSSGQVQAPASAPAQTSVAPANVLGAYQLQQNALQNNYDAQMQNNASGLGGLFNLGAAALKTFMPAGL